MAVTEFELGVGVEGIIEPTPDSDGHIIKITGAFRSGGMTDEEVVQKFQEFWQEIDIDG